MDRDYIIKSGDEYLVWVESGSEPDERGQKRLAAYARDGRTAARWIEVEGHRWAWVGYQSWATRFAWREARDVLWNKLKSSTHAFGVKRSAPIADRWAFKLVRLVPTGDTMRPDDKRMR